MKHDLRFILDKCLLSVYRLDYIRNLIRIINRITILPMLHSELERVSDLSEQRFLFQDIIQLNVSQPKSMLLINLFLTFICL